VPPFSALICYEAIFPHEAVAGGRRPEWIVQLTNDAWFGTFAGPQQHYAQARIRAIEQGLPIVRAANTGISAVVDPYGREVESLPLDRYGKVDRKLPAPLPPTLYSRTGDLPALASVVILLFFGAGRPDMGRKR
jgi:apolipoprotein N-acyltransferase